MTRDVLAHERPVLPSSQSGQWPCFRRQRSAAPSPASTPRGSRIETDVPLPYLASRW
jgi:hypothetical protein